MGFSSLCAQRICSDRESENMDPFVSLFMTFVFGLKVSRSENVLNIFFFLGFRFLPNVFVLTLHVYMHFLWKSPFHGSRLLLFIVSRIRKNRVEDKNVMIEPSIRTQRLSRRVSIIHPGVVFFKRHRESIKVKKGYSMTKQHKYYSSCSHC